MNYFIDTEFIEGKQDKKFLGFKYGETKPTIDLISIGIVDEMGHEYYAISKDFNFDEAWNRYDLKQVGKKDTGMTPVFEKVYWIRENVLKPLWFDLFKIHGRYKYRADAETAWNESPDIFKYIYLKLLIQKYGKSNAQIAAEIIEFIYCEEYKKSRDLQNCNISISEYLDEDRIIFTNHSDKCHPTGNVSDFKDIKFYAYYADYDWVAFAWLFGKMINLPKGFPFYCRDLKQIADNIWESTKINTRFESPKNEHNALADANWNKEFYEFLRDQCKRNNWIFLF